MNRFGFLAQNLFNRPLMLHPRKAEIVLGALSDRIGLTKAYRADGSPIEFEFAPDDEMALPRRTRTDSGYDMVAQGVACIPVEGTLVQRLGSIRPESGMTGYDGITRSFVTAMNDAAVKTIILSISSGGGEVAGCFQLCDILSSMRGIKPVFAILNESAYSAAYAIASCADRIFIPRTGGAGSIGVVCMRVDLSKALEAGGIRVNFITSGAKKAFGHPETSMSPAEAKELQDEINSMADLFVETVARNRSLSPAAIRKMEAGCFIGARAVQAGLADEVAWPEAAFGKIIQTAQIKRTSSNAITARR
jgi:signal peptide peptidase SppA